MVDSRSRVVSQVWQAHKRRRQRQKCFRWIEDNKIQSLFPGPRKHHPIQGQTGKRGHFLASWTTDGNLSENLHAMQEEWNQLCLIREKHLHDGRWTQPVFQNSADLKPKLQYLLGDKEHSYLNNEVQQQQHWEAYLWKLKQIS